MTRSYGKVEVMCVSVRCAHSVVMTPELYASDGRGVSKGSSSRFPNGSVKTSDLLLTDPDYI